MKEVRPTEVLLSNGDVVQYGLCVWSTGVGPTTFTTSLPFAKTARGRIAVDPCLRVMAPHELAHGHEVSSGPGHPSEVDPLTQLFKIKHWRFFPQQLTIIASARSVLDERKVPFLVCACYISMSITSMVKQSFKHHHVAIIGLVCAGAPSYQRG